MDWHVAEPGPRKRRPQTERDTRVKLHCSVALTALCGLATARSAAAYAGSKPNRKKARKLSTVARHRHAASRFERIHVRSYTLEDQISSLRVRRGAPCAGLPPKIATKGGLKRFKFCKESDVLFCKVTPTLLRSGRGRCPEWSPRRRSRRCLWLGLA